MGEKMKDCLLNYVDLWWGYVFDGEGNLYFKGYEIVYRRELRMGYRFGFYGGVVFVEGFDVIGNW